jgi:hypothetical protein
MGFPESLDPLNDQNGHGTHGVSVLLKTAPVAAIYLARTVDDAGRILDSNDYEETIKVGPGCHYPHFRQSNGRSVNEWISYRFLGVLTKVCLASQMLSDEPKAWV